MNFRVYYFFFFYFEAVLKAGNPFLMIVPGYFGRQFPQHSLRIPDDAHVHRNYLSDLARVYVDVDYLGLPGV